MALWEKRVDRIMSSMIRAGVFNVDEHRRAMETMDPKLYERLSYYHRWVVGIETLLVEKGVLTKEEIDRAAST